MLIDKKFWNDAINKAVPEYVDFLKDKSMDQRMKNFYFFRLQEFLTSDEDGKYRSAINEINMKREEIPKLQETGEIINKKYPNISF